MISSCKWEGGKTRQQKLTNYTATAFLVTTENNVLAAKYLLENYAFSYILPAIWSQDPVEKFFGQARQRFGGNFYIDVCDVLAAGRCQRLHQMMKWDIVPQDDGFIDPVCSYCTLELDDNDLEVLDSYRIADTQDLLISDDILKHKVVFIAGYISRANNIDEGGQESVSTEFLDEYSRGGLSIPTLDTVYFVHCANRLHEFLDKSKKSCGKYFERLLAYIEVPAAKFPRACRTVRNVIFKAFSLDNSDRAKQIGCLRRKEKLAG